MQLRLQSNQGRSHSPGIVGVQPAGEGEQRNNQMPKKRRRGQRNADAKNSEYHRPHRASQQFCYCQRTWNPSELQYVSPITCNGPDCFWNNYFHRLCLRRADVRQTRRQGWLCPDCKDAVCPPIKGSNNTNKSRKQKAASSQRSSDSAMPSLEAPLGSTSSNSARGISANPGVPNPGTSNINNNASDNNNGNLSAANSVASTAANAVSSSSFGNDSLANANALGNFQEQQNLSLAQTISQLGHLPLVEERDGPVSLESIDKKHIKTWRPSELIHWISHIKNKLFSPYSVNFIAQNIDGREAAMLSQPSIIKLCNNNRIHGELVYKAVRQRLRLEEHPVPGKRHPRDQTLQEWAAEEAKFAAALHNDQMASLKYEQFERTLAARAGRVGSGIRVGRKKRCKTAVTVRDVVNYIKGFERVMENGKLSRRVAAVRADAPISRGSYHNYLTIRDKLLARGYDLSKPAILDSPFKKLLAAKEPITSNQSQPQQQVSQVHQQQVLQQQAHQARQQQQAMQQQAMQYQALQQLEQQQAALQQHQQQALSLQQQQHQQQQAMQQQAHQQHRQQAHLQQARQQQQALQQQLLQQQRQQQAHQQQLQQQQLQQQLQQQQLQALHDENARYSDRFSEHN